MLTSCKSQKHLSILMNSKLTFEEHYKAILNKTNRTIGLLHKLQSFLPRTALITICKALVRPHLEHGGLLCDQRFVPSKTRIHLVQYLPRRNENCKGHL